LVALAEDLPSVCESPSSDPSLKQKSLRILIEEIVADVDEGAQEVVLVIHWIGGRHSELRVAKMKAGEHSRCTKAEAVDIVRQMSGRYPGRTNCSHLESPAAEDGRWQQLERGTSAFSSRACEIAGI